jgi:hypothetical protein
VRRKGMTYRIHDFGPLTLGLDPRARFGCYYPQAFVILRRSGWLAPLARRRNPRVKLYTRRNFPLPHVTFARAFRLRRLGALWLYRFQHALIYRLAA